jgi:hypothetical protein
LLLSATGVLTPAPIWQGFPASNIHHVRLIRVMCTGRVNHGFLLKAFLKGADGLLVSG